MLNLAAVLTNKLTIVTISCFAVYKVLFLNEYKYTAF